MDYQFFGDQEKQFREAIKNYAQYRRKKAVGCFVIAGCFVLGLIAPIAIIALI